MIKNKIYLVPEFMILFFCVPLLLLLHKKIMHPSTILFPVLAFILILLHTNSEFKWKELFQWKINKPTIIKHSIIISVTTLLMLVFVTIFIPGQLFNLPKNNPRIWLLVCLFYPLFSVFAQEIIFRVYIYKRYKQIFNNQIYFILASGVSFSFAHIFYFHPVSLILTFFLGIYLAKTYVKTKSVLFTSILHSILGNVVFTIGLGQYFWIDMYKWF